MKNDPCRWFSLWESPHSRLIIARIAMARRTEDSVGVVTASS
jgi:hypothetical protein